jgi:hypothetical protein
LFVEGILAQIFLGKLPKGDAAGIGVRKLFVQSEFTDLGPCGFVIYFRGADNATPFYSVRIAPAKQCCTPAESRAFPFACKSQRRLQ